MTDFLKTWPNAAAAAINASTGIPYAPVPADMRDDLFSRAEAASSESARVLKLTPQAAGMRYLRAMRRLRELLDDAGGSME